MKVTEFFIGFGPTHLVVPAGRDRVRHQAHPARRLRAHHRHEQPRGGRARRRGPHLPREGLLGPAAGGAGRPVHEPGHRLRAAVRRSSPASARPAPTSGRSTRRVAGTAAADGRPAAGRPRRQPRRAADQRLQAVRRPSCRTTPGKPVDIVVDPRRRSRSRSRRRIGWALADGIGRRPRAAARPATSPSRSDGRPVADLRRLRRRAGRPLRGHRRPCEFERRRASTTYRDRRSTTPVDAARPTAPAASSASSSISDTVRQGPLAAVGSAGQPVRRHGHHVARRHRPVLLAVGPRPSTPTSCSRRRRQGADDQRGRPSSRRRRPRSSRSRPARPTPAVSSAPSAADQNRVLSLLGVVRLGGAGRRQRASTS